MDTRIALVELTVYERLLPLVSGYLEANAREDSELRRSCHFEKHSFPLKTPRDRIIDTLIQSDSDVFAFSCYVWNMGLVRQILAALVKARPDANFILGGPQVINQAHRYVEPRYEQIVVCNGEGERTFTNYLRALQNGRDFEAVRGLSFYRDEALITTTHEDKIMDLEGLPSPFLNGLFEDGFYTYATFETNRGCPYRCSFCYWGLGEMRVAKFDEPRIREELTWLSNHGYLGVFLADANWGMLRRDVDLSRHIAECKQETGFPYVLVVNSAKNNAPRLVEIAEIFQDSGIMTTQSIAVQSLDEATLHNVDRSNIKVSAYAEAQRQMNALRLSSYVELIWPLPGETLYSFMKGVDELCSIGAQSFIPYPLMLINNTTMSNQRKEFGLITIENPEGAASEAELVIETREVSQEDQKAGQWFCFSLMTLYNARTMYCLSHYLSKNGISSYADLFATFAEFSQRHEKDSVVKNYMNSLTDLSYYEAAHWGRLLHYTLHEHRAQFGTLLLRFAAEQSWWCETTRTLLEIDMVNKLYVYSNTPISVDEACFEILDVAVTDNGYRVRIPTGYEPWLQEFIEHIEAASAGCTTFDVTCIRDQMPFMKAQSLDHNANYCHAVMENIRSHMPIWTRADR